MFKRYVDSAQWSTSGVPASLANYSNNTTSYDSTTGVVSCSYTSNAQNEAPFLISYNLTNGFGGYVESQSNNAITIILPAGLMG